MKNNVDLDNSVSGQQKVLNILTKQLAGSLPKVETNVSQNAHGATKVSISTNYLKQVLQNACCISRARYCEAQAQKDVVVHLGLFEAIKGLEESVLNLKKSIKDSVSTQGEASGVVFAAKNFTEGLEDFYGSIEKAEFVAHQEISTSVQQLNQLLKDIYKENVAIGQSFGNKTLQISQQRKIDGYLEELSKFISIKVNFDHGYAQVTNDSGSVTFVNDQSYKEFSYEQGSDPQKLDQFFSCDVSVQNKKSSSAALNLKESGSLSGLQNLIEVVLPEIRKSADDFANEVTDSVNASMSMGAALRPDMTSAKQNDIDAKIKFDDVLVFFDNKGHPIKDVMPLPIKGDFSTREVKQRIDYYQKILSGPGIKIENSASSDIHNPVQIVLVVNEINGNKSSLDVLVSNNSEFDAELEINPTDSYDVKIGKIDVKKGDFVAINNAMTMKGCVGDVLSLSLGNKYHSVNYEVDLSSGQIIKPLLQNLLDYECKFDRGGIIVSTDLVGSRGDILPPDTKESCKLRIKAERGGNLVAIMAQSGDSESYKLGLSNLFTKDESDKVKVNEEILADHEYISTKALIATSQIQKEGVSVPSNQLKVAGGILTEAQNPVLARLESVFDSQNLSLLKITKEFISRIQNTANNIDREVKNAEDIADTHKSSMLAIIKPDLQKLQLDLMATLSSIALMRAGQKAMINHDKELLHIML